jgi:hypothetical protein
MKRLIVAHAVAALVVISGMAAMTVWNYAEAQAPVIAGSPLGDAPFMLSQAPVIGQGGAAPCPPIVARGPHLYGGCGKPSVMSAGCGSAAMGALVAFGSDVSGRISLGDDYVANATCTVNFATPWLTSPACVMSPSTTGGTVTNVAASTIALAFQASATSMKVNYVCIGQQPP